MYNLPEMQAVNADFWDGVRRELQREGIESLPGSLDFARRPVPERIERDTLLTQVCGYPLQTIYRGQAALLGAPVYAPSIAPERRTPACSSSTATPPSRNWPISEAATSSTTAGIRIQE
jgi:hypothetical protein